MLFLFLLEICQLQCNKSVWNVSWWVSAWYFSCFVSVWKLTCKGVVCFKLHKSQCDLFCKWITAEIYFKEKKTFRGMFPLLTCECDRNLFLIFLPGFEKSVKCIVLKFTEVDFFFLLFLTPDCFKCLKILQLQCYRHLVKIIQFKSMYILLRFETTLF